jgi:hypothetical protein
MCEAVMHLPSPGVAWAGAADDDHEEEEEEEEEEDHVDDSVCLL